MWFVVSAAVEQADNKEVDSFRRRVGRFRWGSLRPEASHRTRSLARVCVCVGGRFFEVTFDKFVWLEVCGLGLHLI